MKILFVAFTTISLILSSCKDSGGIENKSAADIPVSREMTAELTSPPNVPRPIGRRKAQQARSHDAFLFKYTPNSKHKLDI